MKYISEFRDSQTAIGLKNAIEKAVKPDRAYRIMEFCGGHTHAIHRYGVMDFLPNNIELIHGPGCPVCVLPIERIDMACFLAKQPETILCCYADVMRIPGTHQQSLFQAQSKGADIRIIYSVEEALIIAKKNSEKKVVFFAIGFETTTPPTAIAVLQAKQDSLSNFSVFCNHVLTPIAMQAILSDPDTQIDGFIGPSHVSIIIGSDAYDAVAMQYKKPIVIAGFEPLDVLYSILLLVRELNHHRHNTINQYTRAVKPTGNPIALRAINTVFSVRDQFSWRGLGLIANSALTLSDQYQSFDAEKRFTIPCQKGIEHKRCECHAIIRGQKKPSDCKLFGIACTPENPLGACMVSSEGACAAYYTYGRLKREVANVNSSVS